MDAELINPFVTSTINVIQTMAQFQVTPGKPYVKTDNLSSGVVSGIIGLAGDKYAGNMVVSFDEGSVLSIVSKMLMEEFKEVSNDVVDAVGEMTNMICGGAKGLLAEKGMKFDMATPVMVKGEKMRLTQLGGAPVLVVPFEIETGKFVVEASLTPVKR